MPLPSEAGARHCGSPETSTSRHCAPLPDISPGSFHDIGGQGSVRCRPAGRVVALETATKALGVRSLDTIGSPSPTSSRNEVLRARTPVGGTVIVKRYLVPEPVAASVLSAFTTAGSECVPGVLAEGPDLLVLCDLGAHGNVVDVLLRNEPNDAAEELRAWGEGAWSIPR